MLQVSVYRYNPDRDEKPFMQDFRSIPMVKT